MKIAGIIIRPSFPTKRFSHDGFSRDEAGLEAHCCFHLAACTELSGKASRPFSGARMAAESTELSADKHDDCMVEDRMAVKS